VAGWESLVPEPRGSERTRPRFIPAGQARRAPVLRLSDSEGQTVKLSPGEEGKVTLVVFWSMALPVTRAAAKHVSDLVERYGPAGVTAIGIVEKKTVGSQAAARFMLSEGIRYPAYYDDFSALRVMGRAAGVKLKRELPCFFIVDRQMRVRMFKLGFAFVGSLAMFPRLQGERIEENAPPGQRIEDFLRKLLSEE